MADAATLDTMSKRKKPDEVPPPAPKADRGPVLYLRLTHTHERALQKFINKQRIKPDRTAVGLTALEELLAKEGCWPPGDDE